MATSSTGTAQSCRPEGSGPGQGYRQRNDEEGLIWLASLTSGNEFTWSNVKDDAALAKDFNAMDDATKATYDPAYVKMFADMGASQNASANTGIERRR